MKSISCAFRVAFIICSIFFTAAKSQTEPFEHLTIKSHGTLPVDTKYSKRATTVLLYGSARNDLLPFIDRNLKQLMQVGSNDNINFLVHLDVFGPGRKSLTQRYIVMRNYMMQVGTDMSMDSGAAATLHDACSWAFGNFPADRNIVVLWNHGTGDLEPSLGRAINSIELFNFNPATKMIELNRSISFFDYLNEEQIKKTHRGICFDESTGHYLTNQQVGDTLRSICNTYLGGKPFDLLLCDACLMQGIGVAYSLKPLGQQPVAHYMIGSQEVVLATGYNYHLMFDKLARTPTVSNHDFAIHVVTAFENTYSKITNDFTQSAIDLSKMDDLYTIIDHIATLLVNGFKQQVNRSVHKFIQKSSATDACTYFEEPSYKDMFHLFSNMLDNLSLITLTDTQATALLRSNLSASLRHACSVIDSLMIANMSGKNLPHARGISIYLPQRRVDHSYAASAFAKSNNWYNMLTLYVQ